MPDFRDYDDVIWASAASTLALTLYDEDGDPIASRDGQRSHEMRGQLAGLDAVVRATRVRGVDRCVAEVALPLNLLVGLKWSWGGELSDLGPPLVLQSSFDGIDLQRAAKLARKAAPSALIEDAIRSLGLVHAVIGDTSVRITRIGSPEGPGFHVECARVAARVAGMMVEARREIGDAPWEIDLREQLEVAAGTFGLDADLARYTLRGSIAGASLSLGLRAAATGYELWANLQGRGSNDLVVETRSSRRGHTLRDLFRRNATGDPAFDKTFAVDAEQAVIERRVDADTRAEIQALGATTLLHDHTGLSVVSPLQHVLDQAAPGSPRDAIARFVDRLKSTGLKLSGKSPPRTPYR